MSQFNGEIGGYDMTRAEKIALLKQQVQSGTHQIDCSSVADAMLASMGIDALMPDGYLELVDRLPAKPTNTAEIICHQQGYNRGGRA